MFNINTCERLILKKGETFINIGNSVDRVYLIIKGSVSAINRYIKMRLDNGSIVGFIDIYSGEYLFNYKALEDTSVLLFKVSGINDIDDIRSFGLNYQELIDKSMFSQFRQLYNVYKTSFEQFASEINTNNNDDWIILPEERVCEYLQDVSNLNKNVFHKLFEVQNSIALYHMYLITKVISNMDMVINKLLDDYGNLVLGFELVSDTDDDLKEDINIQQLPNIKNNADDIEFDYEFVEKELSGSLDKIVSYAGIDKKEAMKFKMMVESYRTLPDKTSTDNGVRQIRKRISDNFYEIYENVFFKYKEEKSYNRLIEMFLTFGFIDEREFDKETLTQLYYFVPDINDGKYNIYTVYDWLTQIYEGKKEPSNDEFDSDYREKLRELKRTKSFTKAEEAEYFNDTKSKVKFEMNNLFQSTNKITSGEISIFYPILTQEKFTNDIKSLFLDKYKIQQAIDGVLDVDYSLFYREQMYYDETNKIDNITILTEVLPDIILMPNVGSKGIMWQEIVGKKRDTPARFVLSEFFTGNLDITMTDIAGMFRWEMCRTIQGNYWNDLREHSLTAEYCDYIQFYKKNKNLSENIKDKIRTQYKNCRNNTRELFVKDYEAWIKYESKGSLRLNKVTRKILYTYCPASLTYRRNLEKQPIFTEVAAQFTRERQKKIKEYKGFNANVVKRGGTVTKPLEDTLYFYENM